MSFQKPIQKFGMDVGEVWQLKFRRKMQKWKICLKITICMNVSRFMNLAAIFSLDLESQYRGMGGRAGRHTATHPLTALQLSSHWKGDLRNMSYLLNKRNELKFFTIILSTFNIWRRWIRVNIWGNICCLLSGTKWWDKMTLLVRD